MKKSFLLFSLLTFHFLLCSAQLKRGEFTIGGTNGDYCYSLVQSNDKGYLLAGETGSYGAGQTDVYVIKFDSLGNSEWTKTIGGTGVDYAYSMVKTKDGGYALAGATDSYGAGNGDAYIIKLDSTGQVKRTRSIGGPKTEDITSVIQTKDRGYAMTGETFSYGAGNADVYIIKLDSAWNLQWTKTIGGSRYGSRRNHNPDKGRRLCDSRNYSFFHTT